MALVPGSENQVSQVQSNPDFSSLHGPLRNTFANKMACLFSSGFQMLHRRLLRAGYGISGFESLVIVLRLQELYIVQGEISETRNNGCLK